jgi:formylglycine-generating enzyme required for sulfatase activity
MHPAFRWCCFLIAVCLAEALCGCGPAEQEGTTEFQADLVTSTGVRMLKIPGGYFEMGSATGPKDEWPVRRVWVDAFLMDQFEVTQKDFARYLPRYESKFKGDDRPMEQLNWQDAVRYCNERSEAEHLEPCYRLDRDAGVWRCDFSKSGYRLPTEAEWEYACRAGTNTRYSCGDRQADLGRYAWFDANSGETTHPVGRKLPNAWGLYDMHGNVAEWCNDLYAADAYAAGGDRNPRGPQDGGGRYVLRGGAYRMPADELRSAARRGEVGYVDNCENREHLGFRAVRRAPPGETRPATQRGDSEGG